MYFLHVCFGNDIELNLDPDKGIVTQLHNFKWKKVHDPIAGN